mmetsp:Transcript_6925/g.17315  ORF Transcript_6925/g.17315 Transcript_6925/m.17315 type:complete len:308 (+) Transcript_6925:317-1240(+)
MPKVNLFSRQSVCSRFRSTRPETAMMRQAASTALGTCVKYGVKKVSVSATEAAVTMPASCEEPPVETTTAEREKEPALEYVLKKEPAMLAKPIATNSCELSTTCPARAARALPIASVSVSITKAMTATSLMCLESCGCEMAGVILGRPEGTMPTSCSPKRPLRPRAALTAVKRAMVTKGPIEPKMEGGTALGALSQEWSGSFFMATSRDSAAAETHAVKGFAVGMATSALRSMMIGACDEATWIWKRLPICVNMMLSTALVVKAESTSCGTTSTTLPQLSRPTTTESAPPQNIRHEASASLAAGSAT